MAQSERIAERAHPVREDSGTGRLTEGGVDGVLARMRALDATWPRRDGVAVFNRVYLAVTQEVARSVAAGAFPDVRAAVTLDVRFAERYLRAVDTAAADGYPPAGGVHGQLEVAVVGDDDDSVDPLFQVIDAFQAKYPNVDVLLKAGSNSELANALLEEQTNPQADVFVTTELFTVQSLAQEGIFQSYMPVGADQLPDEFGVNGRDRSRLEIV